MANIKTMYMGIEISSPVVVAACSLSSKLDSIKKAEALGAGAIVMKSLFEEQIRHEAGTLDDMLQENTEGYAESLSFFPNLEHAGPKEHLLWTERMREAVSIPIIGSLNAVSHDAWGDYARQLEETGVNALELNVYSVEADPDVDAATVEQRLMDIVGTVREQTRLPLSIKLSPYYTSVANVVSKLEATGATGVVMFNRFFQPDINPDTQQLFNRMTWSSKDEMRVPLRWISLLYGTTTLDLVANSGVQEPKDIAKFILAGAKAVQVAGVLYRKKLDYLGELVNGFNAWMDEKGYATLDDCRGRLSRQGAVGSKSAFERAQYFDFLLKAGGETAVAG